MQPPTVDYQSPAAPPRGARRAVARRIVTLVTGVLCCVYALLIFAAAHVLSRMSMTGNYYKAGYNFITFFWGSFAFTGMLLFIYGLLSNHRQGRLRLVACALTLLQFLLAAGVCALWATNVLVSMPNVTIFLFYVAPQLPILVLLAICFIILAKSRDPMRNPYDATFGSALRRLWDKLCGY